MAAPTTERSIYKGLCTKMGKWTFVAADYAVFAITLVLSAFIGIYYAIKDARSKAGNEEYLLAGRSMPVFPVAMSLTVSFMSAITILGTPAEVYVYGTMYSWVMIAFAIVAVIVSQVYIPVFYRLGITSTYEYLEKRFNQAVRILGTITYLIQNALYMGIVIYGPALALNAVTGFNLWMAISTTGLVCTFYTTLGGLKAVLWTDVFQFFVMVGGLVAVIIRGSILQGGFANTWRICVEGGRIDFLRFDTDMHIRHSFWSIMLGGCVLWVAIYGVSQSQVQRYLSCKSAKRVCIALTLNVIGLFLVIGLSCMCGLVIYGQYSTCDPLSQGCISAGDQILPYLVMDILRDYPGIPGLFVACVFSGSLSTVSSGINAMATVTLEDFIKPFTKWSERTYMWTTKGLSLLYGLVCIAVAVMASYLGSILQAALSIGGMLGGPLVGVFTLGFFIPFANSIGAFSGLLSGVATATWMYVGSRTYKPGVEYIRRLPLDTSGCNSTCYDIGYSGTGNVTTSALYETTELLTTQNTTTVIPEVPAIASFYTISYLYVAVVGMAVTVSVGIILSLATNGWRQRKYVDPQLLAPFFDHPIFLVLPEKFRYAMRCCIEFDKHRDKNELAMVTPMGHYREKPLSSIPVGMEGGYENEMDGIVEDQPAKRKISSIGDQ